MQKAGTSSLFELIAEHPQVARPKEKELQFFTKEKFNWRKPDYEEYNRSIQWKPSSAIAGEGTPRYLFWPQAMERIRAYNPDMRIILSFRDPIERAFSHWSMAKGNAGIEADFGQAITNGWATHWPRTAKEAGKGRGHTLVSRGFYGEQVEHALTLFDRDQFLLLDYHRVFTDLGPTLQRIAAFLGLDPFAELPTEQHVLPAPKDLVADAPTGRDVSALAGLYAADLRRFAELSGFDISRWPTTQVLAGTLDPDELASRLAERAELITPEPRPSVPMEEANRGGQRTMESSR